MKRKLSIILAIVLISSLITTNALAYSQYISNPDDQEAHNYNEQMAYKYAQMIQDLDAQFKKDNPTVNYYSLIRTDWNANVFTTWAGSLLYTNYNGVGYYTNSGYTTISDGYRTHTVITLSPDPKPAVTKKYVTTRAEYVSLKSTYENNAQALIEKNIDAYGEMLDKLIPYIEDPHVHLVFQIGNYTYRSGKGNPYPFWGYIEDGNRNAYPYIKDGNTMIPIRPLIEGLKGTVTWDNATQTITASLNRNNVVMRIGENIAFVNDEPIQMTTEAEIKGGKTMIPLRFVAEHLGYGVDWVQDTQVILIKDSYKPFVDSYEYETLEYSKTENKYHGTGYILPFHLDGYYNGYWHRDDTVTPMDTHGLGNYWAMDYSPMVTVRIMTEDELIERKYYSNMNLEYKYTTSNGIDVYEQMYVYRYGDDNREESIYGDYNDIGSIDLDNYFAERRMMLKAKRANKVIMVSSQYINAKYETSGEVFVYPDATQKVADIINACFDKIATSATPIYKTNY